VTLGFSESSYTALEGDPGQVCVVILHGGTELDIQFVVTQSDITASCKIMHIQHVYIVLDIVYNH